MRLGRSPTNMERVVVTTQAVQDGLFGSDFVFGHMVWFAILGNGFAFRRASNHLGEFLACGLRTKVEARALGTRYSLYNRLVRPLTNKRAYATPFVSTRVLSRSTMMPLSSLEVYHRRNDV